MECPLFQLDPVPSCPVAGHHWEGSGSSSFYPPSGIYTWIRPPWASPRLNSPSSPSLSPWGTLSLGNWMMLRYHDITGKPSLWLTGVFWELLVWGTMSKLPDFCIAVPLLWDWEFLPCQRHMLVSSLLLVSQCTGVTLISKWPRLGAHILPVRGRWMFPFSQT